MNAGLGIKASQSTLAGGSKGSAPLGKDKPPHSTGAIPLTKKKVSFTPSAPETVEGASKYAKTPRGQGGQGGEWRHGFTDRVTAAGVVVTAGALAAGANVTGASMSSETAAGAGNPLTATETATSTADGAAAPSVGRAGGDESQPQNQEVQAGGLSETLLSSDVEGAEDGPPPVLSSTSAEDGRPKSGEPLLNGMAEETKATSPSNLPSWIRVDKDTGHMWRSMTADDLADAMSARLKAELGYSAGDGDKGEGKSGRTDVQSVAETDDPGMMMERDEDEYEALLEEREMQQIDEEVVQGEESSLKRSGREIEKAGRVICTWFREGLVVEWSDEEVDYRWLGYG